VPISYRIDKAARVVVCTHTGKTSDTDFIQTYTSLFNDPEYEAGIPKLIDLRKADSVGRSGNALMVIGDVLKRQYAGSSVKTRIAIVAPADLSFGLGRMYDMLTNDAPQKVGVFRSVEKAVEWLGVSLDSVAGLRDE
jgi:hypothetical protein